MTQALADKRAEEEGGPAPADVAAEHRGDAEAPPTPRRRRRRSGRRRELIPTRTSV